MVWCDVKLLCVLMNWKQQTNMWQRRMTAATVEKNRNPHNYAGHSMCNENIIVIVQGVHCSAVFMYETSSWWLEWSDYQCA